MIFFFGIVRTAFAVKLIAEFSLKSIFNYVMSFVFFKERFYLFHQLIEELISIALNERVDGSAFVGNERFAELPSID